MTELIGHLTSVDILPWKSFHRATVNGLSPTQLDVGRSGLEVYGVADREFLLVEANPEDDGLSHFVTQRGWGPDMKLAHRQDRRLALLLPDITECGMTIRDTASDFGKLELETVYDDRRPQMDVKIFGGYLLRAFDQGPLAAEYFSDFLGRAVRAVRANREYPRILPAKYHRPNAVNQTYGSDGFPMLLVNQASLDASHDANGIARGTVPIEQYRGNATFTTSPEFAWIEDYLLEARLGNTKVYGVKNCQRCPIPGIDQETSQPGAGGQTVLRGRLGYIDDPNTKQNIFGLNINHVYEPGSVMGAGDQVEVLERSIERNFTLLSELTA